MCQALWQCSSSHHFNNETTSWFLLQVSKYLHANAILKMCSTERSTLANTISKFIWIKKRARTVSSLRLFETNRIQAIYTEKKKCRINTYLLYLYAIFMRIHKYIRRIKLKLIRQKNYLLMGLYAFAMKSNLTYKWLAVVAFTKSFWYAFLVEQLSTRSVYNFMLIICFHWRRARNL